MPAIMDTMDIAFPHLGIYLRGVPKTITIGSFSIAWYGVILAFAMLMGILMAARVARKTGQDPNLYWDVSIWLLVFSVLGARIYYVIFFWDAYKDNPLQILNLRGGGLAIYGGIIGGVLTLLIYCRIRRKPFLELMDTAVYGLVLGQAIGRWGNFVNREVFGRYTDTLFAMRLPVAMVRERDIDSSIAAHMAEGTNYIQVHPTFLYESVWNLCLLLLMLFLVRKRRFRGEVSLLYFGGYGLGRGIIEYIRTDQLYITGTQIPVNMVLGFAVFALSCLLGAAAARQVRQGRRESIDYSRVPPFGGRTGQGAGSEKSDQ